MALSIAILMLVGLLADWVVRQFRLPGLTGMILVGVAMGPSWLNWLDPSLLGVSSDLRLLALVVILLRAGFELSRDTLHKVGGRALLLAFIPATCEGAMIAWIAGPLLGLTLLEGILLGSVLAAVSPAVVVPLMIRFIKERRGAEKSIPSLVMAAASVDDIYVIVVHSIALGAYVGAQTNMGMQLASIPISLLLGGAAGFVLGLLFCVLFDRFNPRATKRALMIIAAAVVLEQVPHWFDDRLPFAGLVGAMAIGYVILERREHAAHAISAKLSKVWVPAEIILFALVGAQVNLSVAWQAGLAGVAVILMGLAARAIGVQCCLMKSSLTWGERGFVTVAFSPKATVQAAIGALPLIAMQQRGMNTAAGETILALAVMSIILTAPTGAWAISAIGRRVLKVGPETPAYQAAIESEG